MFEKNTLYQYQGGGYDGCYWEWNFFYISKEGIFHDIFSSGRDGCDTEEKALEHITSDNTIYKYYLDIHNEIVEFSKETHPLLVKMVMKWFEKYDTVNMFVVCSRCGSEIECSNDIYTDDEYNPKDILCEECYYDGYCQCCESYVGENQLDYEIDDDEFSQKVLEDLGEEYGRVCVDCFQNVLNNEKTQQRKDLFNQSLLTGEPDLFSEEMRDFWEGE